MNGWKIGLLAWYALNALFVIGMIGKPRKTVTPDVAVCTVVILAALAFVAVKA